MPEPHPLEVLLQFLDRLGTARIAYSLYHSRYDAIMVEITVPGEKWEVEFLADGVVEVERYVSSGQISGSDELAELFSRFSEPPDS